MSIMKLTILATSDIHGNIYPLNYNESTMDMPHGLFKVASVIEEERNQADGPVVLIDNGDFIQGSPYSQYVKENHQTPEALVSALNDIDYDAGVLGNHEFNYGLEYLKAGITLARHPVLSANILQKDGRMFADAGAAILKKAGIKIGILGLTTQYIPHWEHPDNIEKLEFHSAVETAKEWVPKLRKDVDLVIVVYHGGFEADLKTGEPTERLTGENEGVQLLKEVPGIDALITGHQHREISSIVHGVPVIQPGYKGMNLGKITLNLTKDSGGFKVTGSQSELLSVKDAPSHEELAEKYQPIKDDMNVWLDKVIGHTSGDMRIDDPALARIHEHPYVEFINRIQLHYSGADVSSTALFTDTAPGYGKDITIRDIILNYPYPNILGVIEVTGLELKEALEQTADYFTLNEAGEIVVKSKFITPKPQPYNYDMYEGIDYVMDISKPVGERITNLAFKEKAIEPEDTLELVTNQYRAVGGGDFSMFEGKEFIREINVSMSDLITAYIKEQGTIQALCNNNFKIING